LRSIRKTEGVLQMARFKTPAIDRKASNRLITRALRCWRTARDKGQAIQPQLAKLLDAQESAILAPALDSLFRFYEAILGRPLAVGGRGGASADERLLLEAIDRPEIGKGLGRGKGLADGFTCALCSTRIILSRLLPPTMPAA